jgi:hypothetical protein
MVSAMMRGFHQVDVAGLRWPGRRRTGVVVLGTDQRVGRLLPEAGDDAVGGQHAAVGGDVAERAAQPRLDGVVVTRMRGKAFGFNNPVDGDPDPRCHHDRLGHTCPVLTIDLAAAGLLAQGLGVGDQVSQTSPTRAHHFMNAGATIGVSRYRVETVLPRR